MERLVDLTVAVVVEPVADLGAGNAGHVAAASIAPIVVATPVAKTSVAAVAVLTEEELVHRARAREPNHKHH
jgi:hypothetical protein